MCSRWQRTLLTVRIKFFVNIFRTEGKYSGWVVICNMATHKRRHSSFERISEFVLNRVRRRRTVTVEQLQRALIASFGTEYFRKQQNVTALQNAMEYLLYTKRLIVVSPNEPRCSLPMDANANRNSDNDDVRVLSKLTPWPPTPK